MSKVRIYARNLLANWIGHAANLLVAFFLLPFVLHSLGGERYGLWSLLVTLTGYMGVLDLGIRASTGRHVIVYIARGEHELCNATVRASLGFFSLIGLLLVGAGLGLGYLFPEMFANVPESFRPLAMLLLPLLAVNVWITAVATVFSSVLAAHDRYDLVQAVNLAMLTVRTAGTVVVLSLGWGLVGLASVTVGATLLAGAGNWALAHRVYRPLRSRPLSLSRERLRELMGYGVAAFVAGAAYRVIHYTDLVIVGATMDVGLPVAVYSVGAMPITYLWGFLTHIPETLFPPTQRAAARAENHYVRILCVRQIRFSLLIGLPVFLGFIFFGREFLRLWVGEGFTDAWDVLALLSGAYALALLTATLTPTLSAVGHVRFNMVLAVAEAAVNLALSLVFVLVLGWGLAGVAGGTLAAVLVVRMGIYLPLAIRLLGISPGMFARMVIARAVAGGAVMSAFCYVVHELLPSGTWPLFALRAATAGSLCLLTGWFLMLSPEGRRKALDALARIVGRPAPANSEEGAGVDADEAKGKR